MFIQKPADIRPSEITDRRIYRQRREFLRAAGIAAASLFLPVAVEAGQQLTGVRKSAFRVDEKLTDYKHVTSYNNFYEFGTDKSDPAKNSKNFRSAPWTVTVDGEVKRPARYQLEDLLKHHPLEERVYRLRCVEAWSMVVPVGRFSARRSRQACRADVAREVRRIHHVARPGAECRASGRVCLAPVSTGRTSRACGWTRPCTR